MKTRLSIIALLAVFTLTSCEKEYTCSCREIDTSTGKINNYWTPEKKTFDNASDAETWCHGSEISGFGVAIKCDLK
jgi:hypothetical protein